MINLKTKNNYNLPGYIIQGLLIVICFVSAALGRWMNYASILACVGFLVVFFAQNQKTIKISYVNLVWCLFFVVYSVCGNLIYNGTDIDTYFLFNYIVVILYLFFVKQNISTIKFILFLLNLFCFFEAIFVIMQEYAYGIWVKLGWTIVGYGSNRISGFMSEYSLSGYVLAIGVILAFYSIKNKYLKTISVVINFFALLLTSKRSHLLILMIGVILLYILTSKEKRKAFFRSIIIAFVIALIFYVFYSFSDSNNAISRLVDTIIGYFSGEDVQELSSNRNVIYEETIAFWQSSTKTVIFGNGWGYFSRNSTIAESVSTAHNVYLQLLCETGLIGCSIFIILGVIGLYHNIRNVLSIQEKSIRNYAIVICYIQFHFFAYCFLGSPLYDTTCLFCYIIALAFSEYLYSSYVKRLKTRKVKVIFR